MKKWAAGGILLLLPFFAFPHSSGDMELQFQAPKFFGAFFLGNLGFSFFLAKAVSRYVAIAHLALSFLVLVTGFGSFQLYPYAYWVCGLMLGLWVVDSGGLWFWKILGASAVLVAIQAYFQTIGHYWPLQYAPGIQPGQPIAFMGQHTKLGAYLSACVPVLITLSWWPAAAFVAFVCLLTKSSFTFASLCAGIVVALRYKVSRRFSASLIVLGLMAVGALYLINPTADLFFSHGRLDVWRDTWNAWQVRPIFGHGPGAFRALFSSMYELQGTYERGGGHFQQAHNDYLQVLFEGGMFGALAATVLLIGIAKAYWKTWWSTGYATAPVRCAQGALAALLVNAIGNFPFQLAPHFLVGIVSLVFLLRFAQELR